jgi:hypothetical protein
MAGAPVSVVSRALFGHSIQQPRRDQSTGLGTGRLDDPCKLWSMAKSKSPKEVGPNWTPTTIEADDSGLPIRAQCVICKEVVIFDASHGQTVEDRGRILQEQWVRHFRDKHEKGQNHAD